MIKTIDLIYIYKFLYSPTLHLFAQLYKGFKKELFSMWLYCKM